MDTPGAGAGADYAGRRADPLEDAVTASRNARFMRAGIGDSVNAILASAKQTFTDLFELIALEAKRAGATLISMAAWGAFALLMAITAWFGLMVALALGLVAADINEIAAVLIVVALNVIGAGAIGFWCMKASKKVSMEATRRQLRIAAAEATEMTSS
jgi:uncharacterized membrane protein YqjE